MAKGIDTLLASIDESLERNSLETEAATFEPPTIVNPFEEEVVARQARISHNVAVFASQRPTTPLPVAEYDSSCKSRDRFIEHAAMLGFLGERELLDIYHQFDDEGSDDRTTVFARASTGDVINWKFIVSDPKHPNGPVRYRFVSQYGDPDEETGEAGWSYRMDVIASGFGPQNGQ